MRRRVTGDMTKLWFDFIYFVCKEEQTLLSDQGEGLSLLARRRVDYRFHGFKYDSGVMTVCCNGVGEVGRPGIFYSFLIGSFRI